jgi:uncharacterized protein
MHRFASADLTEWRSRPDRKPLVIRGARQVGKSHLVRQFADQEFDSLLLVDFENDPDLEAIFVSRRPREILQALELRFDQSVVPGKTLLFLDEIQAGLQALPALRYFYEQVPELHIIAAGSLLDFALADHQFSMPVGRIEYLHLGPMQFEEFLLATRKHRLREFLSNLQVDESIAAPIHDQLMREFRRFLVVGGMPEVVAAYAASNSESESLGESLRECGRPKHALLSTFEDDFGKYRAKVDQPRLRKLYRRIPQMVGNKFKYVHVDRHDRSKNIAAALQMLNYARVCHTVRHSTCDGVPLGASASERHFKVLFLDVGLAATACGLSLADFDTRDDITVGDAGRMCEQFVGQHLLYSRRSYQEPELHYWMREKRGASAEVDYVISVGPEVIPVEVKSGKTGTLKSMQLFLREKGLGLGVRINGDVPSMVTATTSLADGDNVSFRLLSLPLYMVGQVPRLCRDALEDPTGGAGA